MPEPTGRTTDHANTHANSHASEHGRRYRLSLEFGAANDRQARRLGMAWAGTAAREWDTSNPIVTPADGEQRDRIAATARTAFRQWINLDGPAHEVGEHFADAITAALPELAELDRLRAEVIRLSNRLTALEANDGELLARAEAAEQERDEARRVLTALPDPSTVEELREKITEILGTPNEATVDAFLDFAWSETARIAGKEMVARWQAEDALKQAEAERDRQRAEIDNLADLGLRHRTERDTAQAAITRVRALAEQAKGALGRYCTCRDCEDARGAPHARRPTA